MTPCEMPAACASADMAARNELKSPPQRAANAGVATTSASRMIGKRKIFIWRDFLRNLREERKCQAAASSRERAGRFDFAGRTLATNYPLIRPDAPAHSLNEAL